MKKIFLYFLPVFLVGLILGGLIGSALTYSEPGEMLSGASFEPQNTEYDPNFNLEESGVNFEVSFRKYKKEIQPYVPDAGITEHYTLTNEYRKMIEERPWELFYEDIVKNSVAACAARFEEYYFDNEYVYWVFTVNEIIYGDIPDTRMIVKHEPNKPYYTAYQFERGKEYLLTLSYSGYSEQFDENLYRFEGGLLVDLTTMKDFEWHNGYIYTEEGMTREEFVKYFKAFSENYGYKTK